MAGMAGNNQQQGGRLTVVKIGGNIIDDSSRLDAFLTAFAAISGHKVLVHGGGKLATQLASQLGIPQQMVDGRRVTDIETLKVVTMVYAGLINKTIVASLFANGCPAMGITGADGNAITAHKRTKATVDFGFAGDVDAVNTILLGGLLQQNLAIIMSPITHDGNGQLLNTNADTIANELATALSSFYNVELVYCFEKAGVLLDANDESTVIKKINPGYYETLKQKNMVFAGMLPKLDNAFAALNKGVRKVVIGKAEELQELLTGTSGTTIIHES